MNKEKLTAFFKTKGKYNWLFVAGLAGIALIGLSGLTAENETERSVKTTASYNDIEEYAEQLETRLSKMISQIEGAGKCKVVVTMEQGTEYVYATEEKKSTDVSETSEESKFSAGSKTSGEETYIMVSTDQGDQPLLLTQLAPRVKGVVVVCDGGGDLTVSKTVTKALATVLDISENRICVVEGKDDL